MKENNYKQCSEGLGRFMRFVVIYGKCRIGIKSFLKVSEKIRGKCKRKKLMEENLKKTSKIRKRMSQIFMLEVTTYFE